MRNISCQRVSVDFSQQFLPGVYVTVFIVGVIANGFGLKSLYHNWKKLKFINIFVLNLGIADILYLLTLPFLVSYNALGSKWIFGDAFCKITRFCFNLNLYGSIGFLTCISVYRYLAVVHPVGIMSRITRSHTVIITVIVWVLVCVQIVPDMFFTKTYKNNTDKCYETTSIFYVKEYLTYSIGWTLSGFCIPSLIILCCYGHMIVVLCTKPNIDTVLKQRCLRLLFILIVLFSVCYIPYHVLKNLNLKARILAKERLCQEWFDGVYIAHQISRGLVCLNSAVNPLIYLHTQKQNTSQTSQGNLQAGTSGRHAGPPSS